MKKWEVYYDRWAEDWNEATPVGNGHMGGMVYGNIWEDTIWLNEETVDYSGKRERINPDTKAYYPEIRRLTFEGRIQEAQNLAIMAMTSCPESMSDYQPLGVLTLRAHNRYGDITHYRRWLDLREGVCHVQLTMGEGRDEREIFASHPDDVLVYHTDCKQSEIELRVKLHRNSEYADRKKIDECTTAISFMSGEQKNVCMTRIRVQGEHAELKVIGEFLYLKNATSYTVLVASATSYRYDDPEQACRDILDRDDAYDYETLKARHIADYQSLYDRMNLSLTDENIENDIPTDKRIAAQNEHPEATDLILLEQLFAFSRYLTVSASRPGTLPMNLQGIWSREFTPNWGSRYTININTEMNYWASEPSALGDCHTVLLDHLLKMLPRGEECARELYGCRGFVCHHNTDIHGDCAPQEQWIPGSYWVLGGAWLATHLYEHYRFTLDRSYLAKSYPVLHEAALFFLDFLTENEDGQLVICPSVSPENTYFDDDHNFACFAPGVTMDTEILHDLFRAVMDTCAILQLDGDFAAQVKAMDDKLPPYRIGRYGNLMEWNRDYEEEEPGHRHISHMYGLYPSCQFTPETPEFFAAARKTVERRLAHGGGGTGWSRAWIICMWARLLDGEKASENLNYFAGHSLYPNLFCKHPPFQIDGNFGAAAGMLELLLQSQDPENPVLLPALPEAWKKEGSVRGIRARGGKVHDFKWKDGVMISHTMRDCEPVS